MPYGRVSLQVEDNPDPEEIRRLAQGLVAHNLGRVEPPGYQEFAVFLRDGDGRLAGGVKGYTQWGWLFMSHLWVDEALRGRGWGRALIETAAREAVRRGCRAAHLDTFGFQAPGFYARLGYATFGTLDDFPPGHKRFFLWKRLV